MDSESIRMRAPVGNLTIIVKLPTGAYQVWKMQINLLAIDPVTLIVTWSLVVSKGIPQVVEVKDLGKLSVMIWGLLHLVLTL